MNGLRLWWRLGLCSLVSVLVAQPATAEEKRIAAGQTWVVTADQQALELSRLVLGDGATVRFAEDVSRWQVTARHVEIGRNVVIDGRGPAGAAGVDGAPPEPAAADMCENGKSGAAGGAGETGGPGRNLNLDWTIATIGSIRLITDGGAGGPGGRGGAGQAGGELNKCRGGDGGAGGPGGAGGRGGDAGSLQFIYRLSDPALSLSKVTGAISQSSAGGAGGPGGEGGPGGAAESGRYMKGSFGGGKKWLAGGEPGAKGAPGAAGAAGADARGLLQLDPLSKSLPERRDTATVGQRDRKSIDRISTLEARVEALEQRLQQLEQRQSH